MKYNRNWHDDLSAITAGDRAPLRMHVHIILRDFESVLFPWVELLIAFSSLLV